MDLYTGLPASALAEQATGRVASFLDANSVAGTSSDTGVPTGLPIKSSLQREAELDDQPSASSQADEVRQ